MRVVLVFPPRASATYVPLGIASLAAFIASAVPGTRVRLSDLNIDTWIRIANADPRGQDLMDFARGRTGTFTDPAQTLSIKPVWDRLRKQMSLLCRQAETFVATGEADAEFLSLMGSHTQKILASDPDLVGISVLFPEQMPFAAALARAVRKADTGKTGTRCRIVMGGAMMSALSVQDLLSAVPEIDAVVSGEGEDAMSALCSNTPFSDIPGLTFRQDHEIRANPGSRTISLKHLLAPDFSLLPLDDYFNPVPVLPVLFSRGCAWRKCRFCAHNFSFGGYRRKPVDIFVSELAEYQKTLGVSHFYSADEYILPRDMDALCEEILARGLKISFHVLGKPTADCTAGRLALWSAAGCRWIGWGIETGSQRLLDLINKGTCVKDIQTVLRDSSAAGISNMGLTIFGLPTSTDLDLDLTLEFLGNAYDTLDGLTASAFVLFNNTHFARNARRYGMHIDGPLPLIHANGTKVRSSRLSFREMASDGSLRAPRGTLEVARWQQYRRWLGQETLLEQLPPEHYLIHVSAGWVPATAPLPFSQDPETA